MKNPESNDFTSIYFTREPKNIRGRTKKKKKNQDLLMDNL